MLVPLPDLPDRLADLPGGPLHLICRSGHRSLKACEFLAARGHDVVNISGGTLAWIEAGESVDAGTGES
jgi:rhodanese-related sulfurtransferase